MEWGYELGGIEIRVLDEESLENNVGYGNIKERAPEGALWFFELFFSSHLTIPYYRVCCRSLQLY